MKRLLFLLGSMLLAGLFALSYWQDTTREWTGYQRRFFRSLSRSERRGMSGGVIPPPVARREAAPSAVSRGIAVGDATGGGIKQLIVSDLHRVDRCTTCHVAIDKPSVALAEEPFKAHPGDYLKWHPPEKFGCTVCHGGQGLATEVSAAHGDVEHWEEPLLRGALVQSSCRKCHGNLQAIESHVPQLVQGIQLYKQLGCAGCHAVHGFGQTVSIDLSDIGDKSWQLLDFTFVEGHHALPQWVVEHFKEPRKVTPGFRKEELPAGEEEIYPSFMPNFGLSDQQAQALTVYMLSLTEKTLPATYVIPPPPPAPEPVYASPVEAGRAVFTKYGCLGCHGVDGGGGRRNWNAQLGQEVPSLVHVKDYYDRDALKEFIRTGRQPTPRVDTKRPRPPLYMPSWKERLSEQDLDNLVEYLFSLSERVAQAKPVEKPAGEAAANP